MVLFSHNIYLCVCENRVRELLRAPKLSQGKWNSPTQKHRLIIKTKPWQWPKGDESLEWHTKPSIMIYLIRNKNNKKIKSIRMRRQRVKYLLSISRVPLLSLGWCDLWPTLRLQAITCCQLVLCIWICTHYWWGGCRNTRVRLGYLCFVWNQKIFSITLFRLGRALVV